MSHELFEFFYTITDQVGKLTKTQWCNTVERQVIENAKIRPGN